MTTIRASEYSPNSPAQPLNPLRQGQVALLNKGAANDISPRVKTVVQRHLGYQGKEVFRTTFTKQEITFALKNGSVAENRTLKLENGHWMLSQNNAPAASLSPDVEDEVDTLVTEILANIGQASRTNTPDSVQTDPIAAVDAVDTDSPTANTPEFVQLKERLTVLENKTQTNPVLEQSLEAQRQILALLVLLIALKVASENQPQGNHSERDELQRQTEELQQTLIEKEQLQQSVAKLKEELFQKEVEHEKAIEAFNELKALCAKDVQAANETTSKLLQGAQAEFKEKEAKFLDEKSSLEKHLQAAQSNLDNTTAQLNKLQTNHDTLRATNEKHEAELVKLSQEKDKFLAKIQKLEEKAEQVEALAEENSILREQIELTQKVFAENAAQMKSVSEQLEIAAGTQKTLQAQNVSLNSKLELAETTNQVSTRTIQDLQASLEENKQQLESTRIEANTAAQKAQESESQIVNELQNVKKAFLQAQDKIEELQKIIGEKDTQFQALTKEASAEFDRMQIGIIDEKKKFQQVLNNEDQKARELKQKIAELEAAVSQKEEEQTKALEKLEFVQAEKELVQGQLLNANESVQKQAEVAIHNNKSIEQLHIAISHLQNSIAIRAKSQESLLTEKASLEKQLEAAQSKLDNTAQQHKELQTANAISHANNEKYVDALNHLSRSYNELESQGIQKTAGQVEALRKENSRLQEEIASIQNVFAENSEQLKKAAQMQETLLAQNALLSSEVDYAKAQEMRALQNLQESLKEKEYQLEISEAAAQNAKKSESQTLNELEKVNQAFLKAQRKVESLEERVNAEFENQLNALTTVESTDPEDLLLETTVQLEVLGEENSKLKEKIASIQNVFAEASEQLEQATQMQATLRAQNTDLNSKLQSAEIALKEKEQQLAKTSLGIEEAKLDVEEAKVDAEIAAQEANERQSKTLTELQKTNDALLEAQRKVEELEGEHRKLITAYDEAQLKLRDLEQQAQKTKEPQKWNLGGWDSYSY